MIHEEHFNKIIRRRQLFLEAEVLARDVANERLKLLLQEDMVNALEKENAAKIKAIIAEIEALG